MYMILFQKYILKKAYKVKQKKKTNKILKN